MVTEILETATYELKQKLETEAILWFSDREAISEAMQRST